MGNQLEGRLAKLEQKMNSVITKTGMARYFDEHLYVTSSTVGKKQIQSRHLDTSLLTEIIEATTQISSSAGIFNTLSVGSYDSAMAVTRTEIDAEGKITTYDDVGAGSPVVETEDEGAGGRTTYTPDGATVPTTIVGLVRNIDDNPGQAYGGIAIGGLSTDPDEYAVLSADDNNPPNFQLHNDIQPKTVADWDAPSSTEGIHLGDYNKELGFVVAEAVVQRGNSSVDVFMNTDQTVPNNAWTKVRFFDPAGAGTKYRWIRQNDCVMASDPQTPGTKVMVRDYNTGSSTTISGGVASHSSTYYDEETTFSGILDHGGLVIRTPGMWVINFCAHWAANTTGARLIRLIARRTQAPAAWHTYVLSTSDATSKGTYQSGSVMLFSDSAVQDYPWLVYPEVLQDSGGDLTLYGGYGNCGLTAIQLTTHDGY